MSVYVAPTGLGLVLGFDFYIDVAPTALGLTFEIDFLQMCCAYGGGIFLVWFSKDMSRRRRWASVLEGSFAIAMHKLQYVRQVFWEHERSF